MEQIKDYYELLHLESSDDTETIQNELLQLERTWKQREISNPEKANEMFVLIREAKDAFKTPESKKAYDHDLEMSKSGPAPEPVDNSRQKQFEDLKQEALQHWAAKRFDYAQKTLEKAEVYYSEEDDPKGDFYKIACAISQSNGDSRRAIDYIDRALMKDPHNIDYLERKAFIYWGICENAFEKSDYKTSETYANKDRALLSQIVNEAGKQGNTESKIDALDRLANSWYFYPQRDILKAKTYANQVIDLLQKKHGNNWRVPYNKTNSKIVLETIEEERKTENEVIRTKSKGSGGCYIATAVYGSYDCPQVWVLRRYRDYNLAQSCFGRCFIKIYYAVSPTVVKFFGKRTWFNTFWKSILDKKIESLKSIGISDKPYNDR